MNGSNERQSMRRKKCRRTESHKGEVRQDEKKGRRKRLTPGGEEGEKEQKEEE